MFSASSPLDRLSSNDVQRLLNTPQNENSVQENMFRVRSWVEKPECIEDMVSARLSTKYCSSEMSPSSLRHPSPRDSGVDVNSPCHRSDEDGSAASIGHSIHSVVEMDTEETMVVDPVKRTLDAVKLDTDRIKVFNDSSHNILKTGRRVRCSKRASCCDCYDVSTSSKKVKRSRSTIPPAMVAQYLTQQRCDLTNPHQSLDFGRTLSTVMESFTVSSDSKSRASKTLRKMGQGAICIQSKKSNNGGRRLDLLSSQAASISSKVHTESAKITDNKKVLPCSESDDQYVLCNSSDTDCKTSTSDGPNCAAVHRTFRFFSGDRRRSNVNDGIGRTMLRKFAGVENIVKKNRIKISDGVNRKPNSVSLKMPSSGHQSGKAYSMIRVAKPNPTKLVIRISANEKQSSLVSTFSDFQRNTECSRSYTGRHDLMHTRVRKEMSSTCIEEGISSMNSHDFLSSIEEKSLLISNNTKEDSNVCSTIDRNNLPVHCNIKRSGTRRHSRHSRRRPRSDTSLNKHCGAIRNEFLAASVAEDCLNHNPLSHGTLADSRGCKTYSKRSNSSANTVRIYSKNCFPITDNFSKSVFENDLELIVRTEHKEMTVAHVPPGNSCITKLDHRTEGCDIIKNVEKKHQRPFAGENSAFSESNLSLFFTNNEISTDRELTTKDLCQTSKINEKQPLLTAGIVSILDESPPVEKLSLSIKRVGSTDNWYVPSKTTRSKKRQSKEKKVVALSLGADVSPEIIRNAFSPAFSLPVVLPPENSVQPTALKAPTDSQILCISKIKASIAEFKTKIRITTMKCKGVLNLQDTVKSKEFQSDPAAAAGDINQCMASKLMIGPELLVDMQVCDETSKLRNYEVKESVQEFGICHSETKPSIDYLDTEIESNTKVQKGQCYMLSKQIKTSNSSVEQGIIDKDVTIFENDSAYVHKITPAKDGEVMLSGSSVAQTIEFSDVKTGSPNAENSNTIITLSSAKSCEKVIQAQSTDDICVQHDTSTFLMNAKLGIKIISTVNESNNLLSECKMEKVPSHCSTDKQLTELVDNKAEIADERTNSVYSFSFEDEGNAVSSINNINNLLSSEIVLSDEKFKTNTVETAKSMTSHLVHRSIKLEQNRDVLFDRGSSRNRKHATNDITPSLLMANESRFSTTNISCPAKSEPIQSLSKIAKLQKPNMDKLRLSLTSTEFDESDLSKLDSVSKSALNDNSQLLMSVGACTNLPCRLVKSCSIPTPDSSMKNYLLPNESNSVIESYCRIEPSFANKLSRIKFGSQNETIISVKKLGSITKTESKNEVRLVRSPRSKKKKVPTATLR